MLFRRIIAVGSIGIDFAKVATQGVWIERTTAILLGPTIAVSPLSLSLSLCLALVSSPNLFYGETTERPTGRSSPLRSAVLSLVPPSNEKAHR